MIKKCTLILLFICSFTTFAQTIRIGALEYGKTRRPESEEKIDFLITAINHVCEVQHLAGTPLDLLVTSEMPTLVGHEDGIMAEEIPGPRSQRLSDCAKANHIWLAAGLFERVMEDGQMKRYNTTVFFDRNGEIKSKYLKTNLPPDEKDRLDITAGTIPLVLDTEFGKIGTLTCWEVEQTANVDILANNGAWLILHPSWVLFENKAISWVQKYGLYWFMSCWDGPSEILAPDGSILDKIETSTTEPTEALVAVATIPLPEGIEQKQYYNISGTVFSKDSTVAGTTIHLSGQNGILTTNTDENGHYLFNVPAGEYDIRPGSTCFDFTNNKQSVSVVDSDVVEIDFCGARDISTQLSFSGTVLCDDVGMSDVVLNLFGDQVQSVKTADDGSFEMNGLYGGTQIIVTPYKQGYVFEPEFIHINDIRTHSENNVFRIIRTGVKIAGNPENVNEFQLVQNYPNPFNSNTTIHFNLPEFSQETRLEIYNVMGQKINSYTWQNTPPGSYSRVWDGKDVNGRTVSAGVYYYLLRAGKIRIVNKMTLLP